MKKILSILITISILFSSLIIPVSVNSAEYKYGAFKYKIKNNAVQITGYKAKNKKVTIPSYINGKKVTSIGEKAFSGEDITSISIPNTVKIIKKKSFFCCENLKKVKLGNCISKIESQAFLSCETLKSINVPKSLKSIGKEAFFECHKLTRIKIPNSVRNIGKEAFAYTGLKKITLGENVKICKDTFIDSPHLKTIEVSKKNKYISSKNNVLYNKKKSTLILYPNANKRKKFNLPKTVTKISSLAFYQNSNLKNISFNKKLVTIEKEAFKECKKLKNVKFPNSLKTIGINAFDSCKKLESVYIPSGVTKISLQAFWYCTKLNKLTIKSNKNLEIGSSAFQATVLESLDVPYAAKRGGGIFETCWKLKTISIPENVDKISDYEFLNCLKLKEVTIPKTVKEIGKYSFGYTEDDLIFSPIEEFTINGYKGTAAEKYAKKNNFKFIALG